MDDKQRALYQSYLDSHYEVEEAKEDENKSVIFKSMVSVNEGLVKMGSLLVKAITSAKKVDTRKSSSEFQETPVKPVLHGFDKLADKL